MDALWEVEEVDRTNGVRSVAVSSSSASIAWIPSDGWSSFASEVFVGLAKGVKRATRGFSAALQPGQLDSTGSPNFCSTTGN